MLYYFYVSGMRMWQLFCLQKQTYAMNAYLRICISIFFMYFYFFKLFGDMI